MLGASWVVYKKLKRHGTVIYHSGHDDTVLAGGGIHLSLAQLVRRKVPALFIGFRPVCWLNG